MSENTFPKWTIICALLWLAIWMGSLIVYFQLGGGMLIPTQGAILYLSIVGFGVFLIALGYGVDANKLD